MTPKITLLLQASYKLKDHLKGSHYWYCYCCREFSFDKRKSFLISTTICLIGVYGEVPWVGIYTCHSGLLLFSIQLD